MNHDDLGNYSHSYVNKLRAENAKLHSHILELVQQQVNDDLTRPKVFIEASGKTMKELATEIGLFTVDTLNQLEEIAKLRDQRDRLFIVCRLACDMGFLHPDGALEHETRAILAEIGEGK